MFRLSSSKIAIILLYYYDKYYEFYNRLFIESQAYICTFYRCAKRKKKGYVEQTRGRRRSTFSKLKLLHLSKEGTNAQAGPSA